MVCLNNKTTYCKSVKPELCTVSGSQLESFNQLLSLSDVYEKLHLKTKTLTEYRSDVPNNENPAGYKSHGTMKNDNSATAPTELISRLERVFYNENLVSEEPSFWTENSDSKDDDWIPESFNSCLSYGSNEKWTLVHNEGNISFETISRQCQKHSNRRYWKSEDKYTNDVPLLGNVPAKGDFFRLILPNSLKFKHLVDAPHMSTFKTELCNYAVYSAFLSRTSSNNFLPHTPNNTIQRYDSLTEPFDGHPPRDFQGINSSTPFEKPTGDKEARVIRTRNAHYFGNHDGITPCNICSQPVSCDSVIQSCNLRDFHHVDFQNSFNCSENVNFQSSGAFRYIFNPGNGTSDFEQSSISPSSSNDYGSLPVKPHNESSLEGSGYKNIRHRHKMAAHKCRLKKKAQRREFEIINNKLQERNMQLRIKELKLQEAVKKCQLFIFSSVSNKNPNGRCGCSKPIIKGETAIHLKVEDANLKTVSVWKDVAAPQVSKEMIHQHIGFESPSLEPAPTYEPGLSPLDLSAKPIDLSCSSVDLRKPDPVRVLKVPSLPVQLF